MCHAKKSLVFLCLYILSAVVKVCSDFVAKDALQLTSRRETVRQFTYDVFRQLNSGENLLTATSQVYPYSSITFSDTIRTVSGKEFYFGSNANVIFTLPNISRNEAVLHVEVRIPRAIIRRGVIHMTIGKGDRVLKSVVRKVGHSMSTERQNIVINLSDHVRPFMNRYLEDLSVKMSFPGAWHSQNVELNKGLLIVYSQDPTFREGKFKENLIKEGREVKKVLETPEEVKRTKRSANSSSRSNFTIRRRRKKCNVRNFIVDFERIGWSAWIVRPLRFNAKICKGVCAAPVDEDLSPTNHAILQSLMRVETDNLKPRPPMPCCVPTKLKPLHMIYFEGQDQIVIRKHENMIVEECGCR